MKKKLFIIAMTCFLIGIGDAYSIDNYSSEHDSELAAKKRRKSKKKSRKKGQDDKKGFVALSGGISLPMGDFGDAALTYTVPMGTKQGKDVNGELTVPCNAKMGFNYGLSLGYRFTDYIGIMGAVQGQSYSMEEPPIAAAGTGGLADLQMKVTNGTSWGMWTFMAGPNLHIPLGKSSPFSFEARVLLGMARVSSPSFDVSTYYEGTNWHNKFGNNAILPITSMKVSSYSTSSFAYMAGIGARYDIGSMFCILLNFDYFGTTSKFSIQSKNREQGVNTLNITAGFGIRF